MAVDTGAIEVIVDEPVTDPLVAQDGLDHSIPDDTRLHRYSVDCVCTPNLVLDAGRIARVLHQNLDTR